MKTDDYRRDYAAYSAALERARYDYHTGVEPELRLAPLRDRYADLWTRAAVDDLKRALEEIPRQFETERVALSALLRAAQSGYLEARAAEVTDELERCKASAHVEWGGARLTSDDAPEAIAAETDPARRRELAARWFDTLRACDDLRAARLDVLREGARSLGCDSYFSFLSGITEAGIESLNVGADDFLERTGSVYAVKMFEWSARHLPAATAAREPVYADSLFFTRLTHLDPFFPAGELHATYEATMSGLGIRIGRQPNVRIETTTAQSGKTRAACLAVNPPEDVRLVYRREGGTSYYQKFFEAAGRAQHFAWVSRDLAARYPELVYAPDETTRAGFAFFYGELLTDAPWLAAHRNVRPSEASEIARSFAFVELHRTRRACVRLRQQRVLEQATDTRSEHLAESYATALEEASNFRAHPALFLRDLVPGGLHDTRGERARLSPAVYLRARLFAAALGEYFRTRHGHRWWSTSKVADELIDMWNTGSRYTVEELASLVGLGALSFDMLADSINSTLIRE
ncbi:MAG TPA: hypothetical protein VGX24_06190 [Pyrinomonadaceae bacterium]|jgi:hypothetical protein|nr:hypothetical protein [Pyrinomonadaceae bacterium]